MEEGGDAGRMGVNADAAVFRGGVALEMVGLEAG